MASRNDAQTAAYGISLNNGSTCEQPALLGPVQRQIEFGQTRRGQRALQDRFDQLRAQESERGAPSKRSAHGPSRQNLQTGVEHRGTTICRVSTRPGDNLGGSLNSPGAKRRFRGAAAIRAWRGRKALSTARSKAFRWRVQRGNVEEISG